MANKQRGYVAIELDKPRSFKFDTNALAELEDALGKPVTEFEQKAVGVRELRAMVWAGLLHEDPKLTIQQAGELIDLERIQEIAAKVTEALQLAFGGSDKGKNAKSGPNGTGQK